MGARNGLDHESVITCDNLVTVHVSAVGASIGLLFDDEKEADGEGDQRRLRPRPMVT